jgi:hypothetical protein
VQLKIFAPNLDTQVPSIGNIPIFRERRHLSVPALADRINRFRPGGFLGVVDLSQVQHGPLHVPPASNLSVLHHDIAPMVFAILASVGFLPNCPSGNNPHLDTVKGDVAAFKFLRRSRTRSMNAITIAS